MPDVVPAALPAPAPPRAWFHLGPIAVTTGRILLAAVVLGLAIALVVGWQRIDVEAVHARARELPGWGVFAVICAAPLVGVPVAMLHVVAGVRFGVAPGLAVVAVATVLHHLIGYGLVRLAPRMFARRLAGWRARFPRGAHRPLTVFSCLLPGMPYAVQIYLLPVLGVPLSVLLTVSAPLHVVRAIVSIVGGDLSDQLTPQRIALLVGYYVVLTIGCGLAFRRVRKALRPSPAPEASGSAPSGRRNDPRD